MPNSLGLASELCVALAAMGRDAKYFLEAEEPEDSDDGTQLSVPDDARVKPIGRNVYALLISDVTQA